MKAITICQPYAHLICITGDKLIENRTWPTSYRGELIIHAGKNRTWLMPGESSEGMAFGAIVGVVDLFDCVRLDSPAAHRLHPWMKHHEHAEGPYCMLLGNRRYLANPIPYKGAQGLWVPDPHILRGIELLPTPPCVLKAPMRAPGPSPTSGVQ